MSQIANPPEFSSVSCILAFSGKTHNTLEDIPWLSGVDDEISADVLGDT
jgi:hypothetical protein